jgi:predicted GNAT superfamily acetyltransferase
MMGSTDRQRQGHNGMAHTQLMVHSTRSREVFREASALYARVFGYTSVDHSLNPKLLSAIVANGGAAVAATADNNTLVGFAYGFVGFDGTHPYLYSQAAFIDPDYQSQGIGRLLKQAQRDIATEAGLTSMRWAFDPLLSRNAHFNLDVLGARGVRFEPRYYDESFSDRLIVDWSFANDADDANDAIVGTAALDEAAIGAGADADADADEAAPTFTPDDWGHAVTSGRVIHVPIPATTPTLDPVHLDALRMTLAQTFTDVFARGFVPVSCVRMDDVTASYRFVPAEAAGV